MKESIRDDEDGERELSGSGAVVCAKCGKEVGQEAGYCGSCGARIGNAEAVSQRTPPVVNGKASASLILGICAIGALFFTYYGIILPGLFGVPGLVLGIAGYREVSGNPEESTGADLAIPGIVLSVLAMAVYLLTPVVEYFIL